MSKDEYTLVNSLNCVYGGPFTRFDPGDPGNREKKSLLDVAIVSTCLVKYIDKLEIAENLQWTPSRSVKDKVKHPDHYALKLTLKNIPMRNSRPFPGRKSIQWNLKKKGGWLRYKQKTENNEKLLKCANKTDESPTKVYKSIKKEITKVKFASFGKVKFTSKTKGIRRAPEGKK